MGARDEGFWSRALVLCGWAEGDAPGVREAAEGFPGVRGGGEGLEVEDC